MVGGLPPPQNSFGPRRSSFAVQVIRVAAEIMIEIAKEADDNLHGEPIRDLVQHDMTGEGEQHAEAIYR